MSESNRVTKFKALDSKVYKSLTEMCIFLEDEGLDADFLQRIDADLSNFLRIIKSLHKKENIRYRTKPENDRRKSERRGRGEYDER